MRSLVPGAGDEGFCWGLVGGRRVGWSGDVLCSGFQAVDFTGAECVPRTRSPLVSGFRLCREGGSISPLCPDERSCCRIWRAHLLFYLPIQPTAKDIAI